MFPDVVKQRRPSYSSKVELERQSSGNCVKHSPCSLHPDGAGVSTGPGGLSTGVAMGALNQRHADPSSHPQGQTRRRGGPPHL